MLWITHRKTTDVMRHNGHGIKCPVNCNIYALITNYIYLCTMSDIQVSPATLILTFLAIYLLCYRKETECSTLHTIKKVSTLCFISGIQRSSTIAENPKSAKSKSTGEVTQVNDKPKKDDPEVSDNLVCTYICTCSKPQSHCLIDTAQDLYHRK